MSPDITDSRRTIHLRAGTKKTKTQQTALQTKRNGLAHRIQVWQNGQAIYMPYVAVLPWHTLSPPSDTGLSPDDDDAYPTPETSHKSINVKAEALLLYLPSQIPAQMRLHPSPELKQLLANEFHLRLAQAEDSLADIRRLRRVITGVTQFKQMNVSGMGVKANTRIRAMYTKFHDKIRIRAARYRAAHAALLVLDKDRDWRKRLKPLDDKDIRGPGRDSDTELGQGHYEISWIWRVPGINSNETKCKTDSSEFVESTRVEWSRSQARVDCWAEEKELLQEEMCRVLAFLDWKRNWWLEQVGTDTDGDSQNQLRRGINAYAYKQAEVYDRLISKFVAM